MKIDLRIILQVLVLVLAVTLMVIVQIMAGKLEEAKRDASIQASNVRAIQDTVKIYEDSISRVSSIMAIQQEISTDSILGLESALSDAVRRNNQTVSALGSLRLEFDSLLMASSAVSVTADSVGDRTGQFVVEGPPIEGFVNVVVPADTAKAWLFKPRLTVTTMPITVVFGCDDERNAFANVETPLWVRANVEKRVITPDTCHPRSPSKFFSFKMTTGGVMVGAALGAVGYFIIDEVIGN